ncbi:MAG: class I tRNA ligase family protein [Gemmataceae bacterium]|nr:class I tRNA ligase family protein [Gemmataceae bacterium]
MAVPAHDERDFAFARQFHLAIRTVVMPPTKWLEETSVFAACKNLDKEPGGSLEGVAPPAAGSSFEQPQTMSERTIRLLGKASRVWEKFHHDPLRVTEFLYRESADQFDEVYTDDGIAFNSGSFDGLPTPEFKQKIAAWLEERGVGARKINYKLRDWLFSRQRYWGEPFPILHELDDKGQPTGLVRALTADELPLTLPDMQDYRPSGRPEPPLGKARDWIHVTRDGKRYLRETNTMPQWAGSCWYYLRYLDPHNNEMLCDPAKAKHWLPVDLYVGGAEHAVLHLLYSRFWHKVLFDRGHVHTPEPFYKLINQGMILGETRYYPSNDDVEDAMRGGGSKELRTAYTVAKAANTELFVAEDDVAPRDGKYFWKRDPSVQLTARADKMSKARGNVINPDFVVNGDEKTNGYGADSLRLFEMFMGPLEAVKPWSMAGVEGVYRFLSRVWRMIVDDRAETMQLAAAVKDAEPDRETLRLLHRTIQKVTEDLEAQPIPRFNTAIAAMMEFTNHLTRQEVRPRSVLSPFVLLLSPFAPHIAEELWHALGHKDTLAYEPWPTFDPALTKAEEMEVPVQVNGKLRTRLMVPPDIDSASLEKLALADEKVKASLEGKQVRKVIIPPKGNKLVNIVVG